MIFCLKQTAFADDDENNTLVNTYKSDWNCTNGILLSSSVCLPHDYDRRTPPSNITNVTVVYSFGNFREVNDKKMTILFDVMIEHIWRDSRLSTAFAEGGESIFRRDLSKLWKPRFYIENLKSYRQRSSTDMLKFEQLLVFNNEDIGETLGYEYNENNTFLSHRFEAQIELYCPFMFDSYPMDSQVCSFKMGSPDLNRERQIIFKINPTNWQNCFELDMYTSPEGNALQDLLRSQKST